MVKILCINCEMHEKNRQGIAFVLNYLFEQHGIEYKIGTVNDIPNYDVVFSVSQQINTASYPNQKFIFGPQFSTFPNQSQLKSLQSDIQKNSIYIQPSEWVVQLWKNMGVEQFLPIKSFAFPVNTEKFKPNLTNIRVNIMIYYKHRHPDELNQIIDFLNKQQITNSRVFNYNKRYNEEDYLSYLKTCSYGILLDAHESQGFAVEEALACDVPLLVWNAQTMNQEYGSQYSPIPCSSIPYWDDRCGEVFYNIANLPDTFQTFQDKLKTNQYSPRQYILDNLSTKKCAERLMELII